MIDQLKQYRIFENKEIETFELLENQGYCNENYLLKAEDQKYLIRKFILENNRKLEFKVQKLAYEKNIAAKPILLDEENGLMICEFLEGSHKTVLDKHKINFWQLLVFLQRRRYWDIPHGRCRQELFLLCSRHCSSTHY